MISCEPNRVEICEDHQDKLFLAYSEELGSRLVVFSRVLPSLLDAQVTLQ
jgi:hypothetical protein